MQVFLFLALVPAQQTADLDAAWIARDVTTYPEGVRPAVTAEGDLDGDGLQDLVSVSWESDTQPRMALLFGDGEGGFEEPQVHDLVLPSRGVVPSDLDGDGDLDLAVSGTGKVFEGNFVEIWTNLGGGEFAFDGLYPTGAGGAPVGLDAADLDGDGDRDLAVALDEYVVSANRVALLLNDGTGAFSASEHVTTKGTSFQVAAEDLDGDGLADLVVAGEFHEVTVLLNTGAGFEPGVEYLMSAKESFDEWPTLELADVDGDGDPDILFSAVFAGTGPFQGDTGLVGLRRNQGNGAFGPLETIELLEGFDGAVDVALADVTGDGHGDLLAAVAWNDLWAVLPGDGTGAFGPAAPYRVGDAPHGIHALDLDQDGDRDVAVLERGAMAVAAIENPGDGAFPAADAHDLVPPSYDPASYSPSVSADFDGDGDLDVLVGFSANFLGPLGLSLARNEGDGTFAPAEITATSVFPSVLASGDLDADGDQDAVYVDDGFVSTLRWRANAGDGTFGPEHVGPGVACDVSSLVLGDVDGDGDPDALVGGCHGVVQVSVYDAAAGAFGPFSAHEVGGTTSALALGDLNGDGDLDLVSNSGVQSYPEVSFGNGDGTFQPPFVFQGGFGVEAIAVADLDGDGVLDLATHDETGETMTVLLGHGDGSFGPPQHHAAAYDDARTLAAADVDGDGDLDLLAPNPAGMDVSLWRNDGEGGFDPQLRLGVGHPPTDLEVGDFDGDGDLDVVALVEPNLTGFYYPGLVTMRGRAADAWTDLEDGLAGTHGVPALSGLGLLAAGTPISLSLDGALESSSGAVVVGTAELGIPFLGGTLVPSPTFLVPFTTDAAGTTGVSQTFSGAPPGTTLWFQAWIGDPLAPFGFAASNALSATTP